MKRELELTSQDDVSFFYCVKSKLDKIVKHLFGIHSNDLIVFLSGKPSIIGCVLVIYLQGMHDNYHMRGGYIVTQNNGITNLSVSK